MAGYSKRTLAQKLGLKEGFRVAVEGHEAWAGLLGDHGLTFERLEGEAAVDLDLVHVFTPSRAAFQAAFEHWKQRTRPAGMIWASWPKKASGKQQDLNEDGVREIVLPTGWVDVKVCAVDETWSGLKLVLRKDLR